MKKTILFLLITIFYFQINGRAKNITERNNFSDQYTKTVSGVYKSDFNELTLYINGNRVTGTYKYKDGRVVGTLNGHTLTGTWLQSNGKGRLQFVFSYDFSSFQGKWGHNDSTPSSKWNGTKL